MSETQETSQPREYNLEVLLAVAEEYNDETDRRMQDGIVNVLAECVDSFIERAEVDYDPEADDEAGTGWDEWQDRLVFATCLPTVVGFLKAHPEFKVEFADLLGQLREVIG